MLYLGAEAKSNFNLPFPIDFNATRTRDSIMEGQDKFIMRKPDNTDVGLREDCEEDLADVRHNADLYVVSQESANLIREAHMGDVSFCFV